MKIKKEEDDKKCCSFGGKDIHTTEKDDEEIDAIIKDLKSREVNGRIVLNKREAWLLEREDTTIISFRIMSKFKTTDYSYNRSDFMSARSNAGGQK